MLYIAIFVLTSAAYPLSIGREITEKIQQTERERNDSHEAYNGAKQKYATAKEAHANKQRELRSVENQIKRHDDDIGLLKREIRKLEK